MRFWSSIKVKGIVQIIYSCARASVRAQNMHLPAQINFMNDQADLQKHSPDVRWRKKNLYGD